MVDEERREPREVTPVQFFDHGRRNSNEALGVTRDFRPNAIRTVNPDEGEQKEVEVPSGDDVLESTAESEGEQLQLFDKDNPPTPETVTPDPEAPVEGATQRAAAPD